MPRTTSFARSALARAAAAQLTLQGAADTCPRLVNLAGRGRSAVTSR